MRGPEIASDDRLRPPERLSHTRPMRSALLAADCVGGNEGV